MGSRTDEEGLKEELSHLAKDAGRYLQIRGELLAIEAKEASLIFKKRSAALIVFVTFASTAYLLMMLGLVGLLGAYLGNLSDSPFANWIGAAFIISGIHLVFAIIAMIRFVRGPKEPLFEYTRREWANDQSWIKQDNASKS